MQALRDYVTAADGYRYANQVSLLHCKSLQVVSHCPSQRQKHWIWATLQAASTLRLDVTHSNLIQRWHDLVFDSSMTAGRSDSKSWNMLEYVGIC